MDEVNVNRFQSSGVLSDGSDDEVEWRKDILKIKTFRASLEKPTTFQLNDVQESSSILNVILSCSEFSASADNVLIVNRALIYLLRCMKSQIMTKLRMNAAKQEELYDKLKLLNNTSKKLEPFISYLKCGMPYFKLPNNWPPPLNVYNEQHNKLGYASPDIFIKSSINWTAKENNVLKELVVASTKESRLLELESKFRLMKRNGATKDLKKISIEIERLKGASEIEIDTDSVDWSRVSVNLGPVFKPSECQSQWSYFVDPKINKTKWTSSEQQKLFSLVKEHKFQSWEKISRLLGSGRTALQCCIVFHRNIVEVPKQCSKADYEKCSALFNYYVNKPKTIMKVSFFMDCTMKECQYRLKLLNLKEKTAVNIRSLCKHDLLTDFIQAPKHRKIRLVAAHDALRSRSSFTSEEDFLLLEAVVNHGKEWDIVCEAVPGKNQTEVQQRYEQLVKFSKDVLRSISKTGSKAALDLLPTDVNGEPGFNIWSILQLFWEPANQVSIYTRCGLPLDENMSASTQQILKVFEFGHKNLFGPRFALPRTDDKKKKIVLTLSVISKALQVTMIPNQVADLLQQHAQHTGSTKGVDYPENIVLHLTEFEAPVVAHDLFRSLVPPNLLTLVGTRVISSARGLLYSQAELPLPISLTKMNHSIAHEDRLRPEESKDRLKKRIISIFFLSICMTKISKQPGQYINISKCPPKKKSKPTYPSKLKLKKNAIKLNLLRWKKTVDKGDPKRSKSDSKRPNSSPSINEPKRAKMIRVTKAGNKSVSVPIDASC